MGKKKPKANGRKPAEKPPGCYVLSLSVENVRCFGPKQTLDCSDGNGRPRQWTVILGDNGSGKTTLLNSLFVSTGFGIQHPEYYISHRMKATGGSIVVRFAVGDNLAATDAITEFQIDRHEDPSSFFHGLEDWRFRDMPSETAHAPQCVCRYTVWRGDPKQHASRFPTEPEIRDPQSWLLSVNHSAVLQTQTPANQMWERIVTLLSGATPGDGVLPGVYGIRCVASNYQRPVILFQTEFGWVSFYQLGHGYQTMIAWVVDFVSRMVERYPDSENPLAEPAVCLVDEIDLHLHPVWQRKVIGYLSERFPNTQFIVTAHSPLVVQAAASADANIAVLVRSENLDADGNHFVEIKNNPEDVRNWRLDQILTSDLFGGLSLNPPKVEELFKEKEHLAGLKRPTPAQKARLAEIDAELAKLPVGDDAREVKEMQAIRDALHHLQKRPVK